MAAPNNSAQAEFGGRRVRGAANRHFRQPQGGGANGKAQSVEINHWDSRVGSKIEIAKMNGIKTSGIYEGMKGEIMTFTLNGQAHAFGLEYNQSEATARLTGQGIDLQLFCSRR